MVAEGSFQNRTMVRRQRTLTSMAFDPGSLRDLDQRDHAPANAGGHGHSILCTLLDEIPDIETLAQADESDVLRHWEGLGYYRRARQMHAAAQRIQSHHQGSFPRDFDSILNLPESDAIPQALLHRSLTTILNRSSKPIRSDSMQGFAYGINPWPCLSRKTSFGSSHRPSSNRGQPGKSTKASWNWVPPFVLPNNHHAISAH